MPIYEYRCRGCGKLNSVFVRSVSSPVNPTCSTCGSTDLERAPTRFAHHRTRQQILEQYGEPGPVAGPDAYKDPRQIGRWVERRFDEMGMELPAEARQMIDAAREGEFPAPVEHEYRLSEDASRYYKTGKGFLYRYMPFWVASLADRMIVILVPIIVLLAPTASAFVISPEKRMPPSAMIGMSCASAARAHSMMAVIIGTPMPATTPATSGTSGPTTVRSGAIDRATASRPSGDRRD